MFNTTVTVDQFLEALIETLYMISFSLVIGALIGVPMGILLVVTRKDSIMESPILFQIMNQFINIVRSLPFIILIVAIIPITKLIVQTSIGSTAAIVPLTIYIAPFIARLV